MPTLIVLPNGIQYVPAAFLSTLILISGQAMVVSKFRKNAHIEYPQVYADKALADTSLPALQFNCAQRAHFNTLENIPIISGTTLIIAAKYPALAASLMTLWSISRVSYTYGYVTGDAKKRVTTLYKIGMLGQLASICLSAYVAGDWIYQGFVNNLK